MAEEPFTLGGVIGADQLLDGSRNDGFIGRKFKDTPLDWAK